MRPVAKPGRGHSRTIAGGTSGSSAGPRRTARSGASGSRARARTARPWGGCSWPPVSGSSRYPRSSPIASVGTSAGRARAIPGTPSRSPGWPFAKRASARSRCPGSPRIWKLLVDARDQRVGERTRVANRLHADLVVLAAGYKREVPNLAGACHRAAVARLLDGLAGVRAELARADLARLRELDAECSALEKQIRSLVQLSGSSLPTITGVAAITAAKLLGETGDPRRVRSTPAFAAMSGTAPIPASSGQTSRHRLNRGGNRQLNRALHTIALVQARTDPRAKAYMARRTAEGKSRLEALRCLKRHLADVVLRTMLADVERSARPVTEGLDNIGAQA